MPSLSKVFSRSKESKEKEALQEASHSSDDASSPPPSYAPPAYEAKEDADLPPDMTAGFANLSLGSSNTPVPTAGECTAHLKLLECLYRLRQRIGSSDGLFGIRNSIITSIIDGKQADDPKLLNILAEKRWAIYVARSVSRFARWRNAIAPITQYMNVNDCVKGGRLEHQVRQDSKCPKIHFDTDNMPPIDVLMVLHSYMLNPRAYLEDCIREGRMSLWYTPLPWAAIMDCIDNETFEYSASATAREHYNHFTNDSWDNTDDGASTIISCLKCNTTLSIPWTTVGTEKPLSVANDDLKSAIKHHISSGTGYADQNFTIQCRSCHRTISRDALAFDKFNRDLRLLLTQDVAMPGTLLSKDGIPREIVVDGEPHTDLTALIGMMFPNRLLRSECGSGILAAVDVDGMDDVRKKIEAAMRDRFLMRAVRGSGSHRPLRDERIAIRKMMSRYWDNPTPFALDLTGAVVRQGSFITSMHDIGWLFSPALPNTMRRSITKYERFFTILQDNSNMAVPTLPIDLVWHTAQCSAFSYMIYSIRETKQFVDHDDKVAETALHDSFAWTSKTYARLFNEPYSECTCWYCEAVRESHTSTTSRLFHTSSAKAAESVIHPNSTDPKKSVHISAHNAVKPTDSVMYNTTAASKVRELEKYYQKACARAAKKGKPKPQRGDYYYSDAYGYPVYMPLYAPYMMGAAYMTPGIYGVYPGGMAMGVGAAGNCCAGTCGAAVAAGGCAGGAGGFGGCAGGAAGGCGASGGGFGGGGCAGGGGGGCGGGGGGGCGGGGGGC